MVASSEEGSTAYIAVVFGGETESETISPERVEYDELGQPTTIPAVIRTTIYALKEAKALLDWAKNNHTYYLLADTSDIICEIPVTLGNGRSHVTLFPAQKIEVYLPAGLDRATQIRTEYTLYQDSLTAPVMPGTVVGTYTIYYLDEPIATVDLTTRSTVDRSILGYYADRVKAFLASATFRKWLLIGVVAWAIYALCMSVWRHQARKKAILRRRREKETERRQKEIQKLDEWK